MFECEHVVPALWGRVGVTIGGLVVQLPFVIHALCRRDTLSERDLCGSVFPRLGFVRTSYWIHYLAETCRNQFPEALADQDLRDIRFRSLYSVEQADLSLRRWAHSS